MSVARARWRCGPRALAKQSQPAARTAGSCVRSPSVATMTNAQHAAGRAIVPAIDARRSGSVPCGSLSTPDDWCALGPGEQGDGNTWRGSTPSQRSTPGAVCRPVGGGVCGFGSKQRTKGLDPAQNGPSTDVDASVGEEARDAFGGGAQLQLVADGQQNDVAREAMAGHQARRLAGRMPTTGTAGAYHTAALIVAVAGQVQRRAVADRHRRSLPEPLPPRQCRRTASTTRT
jgi:hypothetical protein